MDKSKVTLRFVGDDVDPQHVSTLLELSPSHSESKGMPVENHPSRIYPTNYWGIDSPLSEKASIADHIKYLLALLEPRKAAIVKLTKGGYEPNFYCGLFYTRYSGYIAFDPDVLGRIARLGASLDIHVYHNQDDNQTTE